MFNFNLVIRSITVVKTTDSSGEDEIYFVTAGGGDPDQVASSFTPSSEFPDSRSHDGENEYYDIGTKDSSKRSYDNLTLRRFQVKHDGKAIISSALQEIDGISFEEFILGSSQIIIGVVQGIAAIVAAPTVAGGIVLGVSAAADLAVGTYRLYEALATQPHHTLGAFSLGLEIIEGIPTFLWSPGENTPTEFRSAISNGSFAEFRVTGDDSDYHFTVEIQPVGSLSSRLSTVLPDYESLPIQEHPPDDEKIRNLILTGSDAINGQGNSLDNALTGNEADNILNGLAGDDALYGRGGNDTLIGGEGSDSMFGGIGNDSYYVDNPGDNVSERENTGTSDTVNASISYALSDNLENLTLLEGINAIDGTGNSADNIITGNSIGNSLDGRAGADTLIGRAGNDSLNGGSGNDILNGNDGNDSLLGDADNDLLVGGAGNDFINGGSGTDTVSYEDASGITINLDEINSYQAPGRYIYSSSSSSSINGFDVALGSSIAPGTALDSLGNQDTLRNLEDIIGSNFDDVLIGNSIGNSIQGLTGNDILMGNAGNDTLDGGAGIDLVSYRYAPLAVTVNLTQNTATDGLNGTDQILNLENIQGSNFSDTLIGNLQINWLFGGIGNDTLAASGGNDILYGETDNDLLSGEDGNDTLMGGQGADVLNGGNGIDTASYLTALTGVIANLANASTNRGDAQGDTFLSIENLVGSRYGDTLTGNSQNNHLWGLEGHDNLNGLGGNDTLEGGLGNDIYRIDSLTATILEYLNQGTDTINASISYTIGANLENLNLLEGTAARDGTGNSLNNIITGNSADNILNGGGGNDFLYGNAGTDSLLGGDGDDWLYGGNGNDILTGGNGNNTFVYKAMTDAGDQISDFKVGNDKLNLTDVVNSSGWRSSNLFADGFLMTLQASSGMAALMIDPDGRGTAYRPAPFILFNNVSAAALGNMSNFVV